MKSSNNGSFFGMALLAFGLLCVQACIVGAVKDTAGNPLADVDVIGFTNCGGAGCDSHRTEVPVGPDLLIGYHTTTNVDGNYVYDPYAKAVAAEDAMFLYVPQAEPDKSMLFSYWKSGYQKIYYRDVLEYQEHTGNDGNVYHIAQVPNMYLCRGYEPDSDGDKICDSAESYYGTNPLLVDTDGNGIDDYEEIFGAGTPVLEEPVNTLKILHANVNCSDFEESKTFYMMLGFRPLIETDVNVTDPAEAAGLNMPPYQLHASPMGLGDGYVIDLIKWEDPYDPSAPYSEQNHLGIPSLSLTTTNLAADMAALTAHGIEYSGPEMVDRPVLNSQLITFRDPDGTLIELVQPGDVPTGGTPNSSGETYITGALRTNINVSNYELSREVYEMLGFTLEEEVVEGEPGTPPYLRAATMALPGGHNLNLTKWEEPSDSDPPYAALNHLGIARIAIETSNLDEDVRILKDRGVQFYSDPITPSGPLSFLRYACFEDPDGTVIELVEYTF